MRTDFERQFLNGARRRNELAFTMVEIAFSMAIVAFALVAIMGVLPTGMTVQKDNREDTIINHDGMYWLEALRSGAKGIDQLTNHVESISVSNIQGFLVFPTNITGQQIIGILSTPKYTNAGGTVAVTNKILARVRAINGAATEMRPAAVQDFVFRYELETEILPYESIPVSTNGVRHTEFAEIPTTGTGAEFAVLERSMATNLQQIRVTLRWPLFQQGTNWVAGRNKRTFRALKNGRVDVRPEEVPVNRKTFYVDPNSYVYVPYNQ